MKPQNHLKVAEHLSHLLDSQFNILGFKFGLDPILGLVYGAGDVVALILSLYIVWIGVQMQLPTEKIGQMVWNVFFDFLLGLIPVIGQASDFVFKANEKNIKILKEFVQSEVVEGQTV